MTEPVDLTNCEREPIHIPGAVQPHEVLLACRPADLVVLQASETVTTLLGREVAVVLGQPLGALFDPPSGEGLARVAASPRPRDDSPIAVATTDGRRFVASLHHAAGGELIVELEVDDGRAQGFHPALRRSLARLQSPGDARALCALAVEEVRALTGFDRVMAYAFDPDWNGEVIAEARRGDLESFLGQHYPASDIPAQARRLYTLNWLRFVADVNYRPSPIVPTLSPLTGQPLDLSFAIGRSVSPIHCEYLRNMGVVASMSISLVVEGKLWGLIACHHYAEPRLVPFHVRDSCELLAQALSARVAERERADLAARAGRAAAIEASLVTAMATADDFLDGLVSPALVELCDARGAAVLFEGTLRTVGEVPPDDDVRDLIAWASESLADGLFVTDRVPALRTPTQPVVQLASGIILVAISRAHGDYVLWTRPSWEHVVEWAGHPHKNVVVDESGAPRLSPRGSFDLWRETVRGRSQPWQPWQIEAASDVRRAILGGVRRRAAELRQLNDQLLAADRAKDVFIATVSHELRTPLNAITGWAQLLRSGFHDQARLDHALGVIDRNARAQAQLVEDLIDVSRMTSGKLTLAIETVDLAQVIDAALESTAMAAQARNIRFRSVLDTAGTKLLGDPRRLQQVVWNLLQNAIKFCAKGGRVDVLLHRAGSDLELVVSDNGEGISPEFLPHVFEVFRQADERLSRERRGLGLGLAIVRHIVEAHGGRIVAESAGLGTGATFRVRLPVSPLVASNEPAPEPTLPALRPELEGVRVAVIEDEADSRELLVELLGSVGATIEAFGTAEDALARIPTLRPDVIVSDIGLPGMDGYELAAKLRQLPEDQGGLTPAVALTAHTRSKDRTSALVAGFTSHVPKPVDPAELLAVLRSLLGRRTPPA